MLCRVMLIHSVTVWTQRVQLARRMLVWKGSAQRKPIISLRYVGLFIIYLGKTLNAYKTPRRFGNSVTNTNPDPTLRHLNKRPWLLEPFEIKTKSDRLEETINNLQSELKVSLSKQTDLLLAILEVLKDGNQKIGLNDCTITIMHKDKNNNVW